MISQAVDASVRRESGPLAEPDVDQNLEGILEERDFNPDPSDTPSLQSNSPLLEALLLSLTGSKVISRWPQGFPTLSADESKVRSLQLKHRTRNFH